MENPTKKIRFSDLSIWLKIGIIGGLFSIFYELIGFIWGFMWGINV